MEPAWRNRQGCVLSLGRALELQHVSVRLPAQSKRCDVELAGLSGQLSASSSPYFQRRLPQPQLLHHPPHYWEPPGQSGGLSTTQPRSIFLTCDHT
jgi:hypothetical protein